MISTAILALPADDATVQIVALVVGLVQTLALAVIADRSRRVRHYDRRRPPSDPTV